MDHSGFNNWLLSFDRGTRKIGSIFAWISSGTLTFLAILVCADVFMRAFFNSPIPAVVEANLILLPWIAMPGFICALITGGHVRMTLIVDRLSPKGRSFFLVFAYIIALLLFGVLTTWGWMHFWESFIVREFMEAPINLPRWLAKLALPVGMFAIFLQFLSMLMLHLRGVKPIVDASEQPLS